MSPARVTVQLPGAPEPRVLDTAVAFLIVNEDRRSVVGCTIEPAELAHILRNAADELEGINHVHHT